MALRQQHTKSNVVTPVKVDTKVTDSNPVGFRDITSCFTAVPCTVTGDPLPEWLSGVYVKQTGAAFNSAVDTALLDGLAGITSFKLNGAAPQSALYSSTILEQKASRDYLASEGRVRTWVGTASAVTNGQPTFIDRVRMFANSVSERLGLGDNNFYTGPNPNVVVWRLTDPSDASITYPAAATEADGTVLRFDLENLGTTGKVQTIRPEKGMVITTPAHYYEPLVEGVHGRGGPYHVALEMVQEGLFPPSFQFTYAIYSGASAPFRRITGRKIARFSYLERDRQAVGDRPGYMHCYAQTSNYLILFISRMRLNYGRLLAMDFSKGFFGLFDSTDAPLEFMVFRINAHDETKPELEHIGTFSNPGHKYHVWHMSNAFEDKDGCIVMDFSGAVEIKANSFMQRARLDVANGTVTYSQLGAGFNLEFPQANPLVNFSTYCFTYALALDDGIGKESFLTKVNVQTGVVEATLYKGKGYLLAEPVFVPRTRSYGVLNQADEEDGVILQATTDASSGDSWLAVVRPSDLTEICRVESPQTINAGLHSHFFATVPLKSKV